MPNVELKQNETLKRKNMRVLIGLVTMMAVIAVGPWIYAPLYKHVCGVLGIKTTSSKDSDELLAEARGAHAASAALQQVRYMGVSGELPIEVEPLKHESQVKLGELVTVMYRLTNKSDRDLDYRAVHSTFPAADPSFELIKCFCDDHRVIKAGDTEHWPVVFRLIKPVSDPNGLTLNYTLFDYKKNDPQK